MPVQVHLQKTFRFQLLLACSERARKSPTVDPFPSASLFSFACVSSHNCNKPRPLCLDVFVPRAAAVGQRHNGTCQRWGERGGGGRGAAAGRQRGAFVSRECLLPLMPIILEELMLTRKAARGLFM